MSATSIIRRLESLARQHGYTTTLSQDRSSHRLEASDQGWPIVLNFVLENGLKNVFFYVHIRIRGQDGARDDQLLVTSSLLACFLRAYANVAASIILLPHPAVEGELGDVLMRLDQPSGSWYGTDRRGLKELSKIICGIRMYETLIPHVFDQTPSATGDCECGLRHYITGCEDWIDEVAPLIRRKPGNIDHQQRINPTWKYLKCDRFFLIKSPGIASKFPVLLATDKALQAQHEVRTVDGRFIIQGGLFNFISNGDFQYAVRILKRLENGEPHAMHVVPLENLTVYFSGSHVLGMSSHSGFDRYRQEQSRFAQTIHDSVSILFPATKFRWKRVIDHQLEALTCDLLEVEPGVTWIRKVGHTRDRDCGKDLVAEINMKIPEATPKADRVSLKTIKLVVQCKAYEGSVGKARVTDIRDTIEHHGAGGYLLVVSSTITSALVDHLLELRRKTSLHIDWWTRAEIEKRLLAHPEIAAKHQHIVKVMPARSH